MRVEAYSAVNRIYQSGAASSAKKGGSTASYSDKLEILKIFAPSIFAWKFQEQQRIIRQQKRQ